MVISASKLKGLPVYTKSGQKLGSVADFELEVESHVVMHYLVRSSKLLHPLEEPLLVHRNQVISITNDRMIVDDLVIKNKDVVAEIVKKQVVYDTPAVNS